MLPNDQRDFDLTIGRLDRALSEMMELGRRAFEHPDIIDRANIQTLKHHAEDMVGAGNKILQVLDMITAQRDAQKAEDT